MKKLNIDNPVLPPLVVINVGDANGTSVGHVTPILSTVPDMNITFVGYSFKETAKQKRTGTSDTVGRLREAAIIGRSSNEGQHSISRFWMKKDPQQDVLNVFKVATAGITRLE